MIEYEIRRAAEDHIRENASTIAGILPIGRCKKHTYDGPLYDPVRAIHVFTDLYGKLIICSGEKIDT